MTMCMTRNTRTIRHTSGNVLTIGSIGLFLVVFTLLILYGFANLLYVQGLLQCFADKTALTAACKLNDDSRFGDMNNLIARSRQLVFASRQMSQTTQVADQDLNALANQLLEEDRQNATALDKERTHLAQLSIAEATDALNTAFYDQTGLYRAILPLLAIKAPQIVSVKFGNVSNVESNVESMGGFDELASYDESTKLVDLNSDLYFANINAKLPGADSDLNFNLSSLAAPVGENVSSARLILMKDFQTPDQNSQPLPSAVEVVISAEAPSVLFSSNTSKLQVVSVAATNGALPSE